MKETQLWGWLAAVFFLFLVLAAGAVYFKINPRPEEPTVTYLEMYRGFSIYKLAAYPTDIYLAQSPFSHKAAAYSNLTLLKMDIDMGETEYALEAPQLWLPAHP